MVSALWTASSEGNIDGVLEQLSSGPSGVDIEIKDQTGSTPLIEAVKNGHVVVVQALLDHGADPSNPSAQGLPESYTSDPAILNALQAAKMKRAPLPPHGEEHGYPVEPNGEHAHQPQQHFYPPPPPGPYMYYPPPPPEGAVPFYPPPPHPAGEHHPGAPTSGHLPPPDVARFIPCRYFPACRYGASCMFAHPSGPFYPGSMPPPGQYPGPYDPIGAQQPGYPHNYYPMPPPPFPPQANGVPPPMSPQSATSPYGHTPQGSELVSPSLNQFSSNHAAVTGHYPVLSPMAPNFSPAQLPPPGQMMAPSPLGEQAPNGGGYPDIHPAAASSPDAQQEGPAQDSANSVPVVLPDQSHAPPPPVPQPVAPQPEAYPMPPPVPHAGHRNPAGHNRRGSIRKGSFSRKPPCLFFPSGKCWNGDACRFAHVVPEANGAWHPPHFGNNGNGKGPRRPHVPHPQSNGTTGLEEKMANVSVQDTPAQPNGTPAAATAPHTHRPQPSEGGNNVNGHNGYGPRYGSGFRPHNHNHNRFDKRASGPVPAPPPVKQRLPSADDFPVLGGSTTPPLRSPGVNGVGSGPTAAQILSAPAPRKETASTRAASPDSVKVPDTPVATRPEANGDSHAAAAPASATVAAARPVSFAAVAHGAAAAPKEVAVGA